MRARALLLTFTCTVRLAAQVLDGSFGNGGVAFGSVATGADRFFAVTTQPDGKVIAVGQGEDANFVTNALLYRYSATGQPDNTFSGDGRAFLHFNPDLSAYAYGVAVQPNGRVVVVGASDAPGWTNAWIYRTTTSGTADGSFGTGGHVILGSPGFSYLQAVKVLADGSILAVGTVEGNPDDDLLVLKVNADGTPDMSYGSGGYAQVDVGGLDNSALDLSVLSDGSLILAGLSDPNSAWPFALAVRIDPSGQQDQTFAGDGDIELGGEGYFRSVLALPGDTLLLLGALRNGTTFSTIVQRYLPDGTLDATFGVGGTSTIAPPANRSLRPAGMALTPAGIVITGLSHHTSGGSNEWFMCRLNGSGSLDMDLGTAGIASSSGADALDPDVFNWRTGAGSALGPDGRMFVADGVLAPAADGSVAAFLPLLTDIPEVFTTPLALAPQPACDLVRISAGNGASNAPYVVVDLHGRTVLQGAGRIMDVSELRPGTYIVRVGAEAGMLRAPLVIAR